MTGAGDVRESSSSETGSGRWSKAIPLVLLAGLSLAPDPWAAIPRLTYFFRDMSVTFYPVRQFAAEELRQGRWPVWNPYLFEGTFVVPYFHVLDLLHSVLPGPVAFSFLLTLQFPIAALCAHALLRDLGAGRGAAFTAGALFSLGGLARSSANLYVFLQALALAPLTVLVLRRAARRGGRWIATAAIVAALGLTTLALEFVAQALALGMAWALVERPGVTTLRRLGGAVALGFGLAGVAVLPLLGLLPETERGTGLAANVLLGHATPPVALVQLVIPNLFGSVSDPVQVWWGQGFFARLPYFLSLYVGPFALALAWAGWPRLSRPMRVVAAAGVLLAVVFSLGETAGLATRLLPLFPVLRYPSKAWLLPYLVTTILAGLGADELLRGQGWRRFGGASGTLALVVGAILLAVLMAPAWVGRVGGLAPDVVPSVSRALASSAALALLLALAGLGLAVAVLRRWLGGRLGLLLVTVLLTVDLVRSHFGMNPQADPSLYRLLPELAAELPAGGDGRVFSYPLATSPAFLHYLERRPSQVRLASFFVNRQLLSPYLNLIDHVRAPDDRDVTSFTPRPGQLHPEDYRPENVGGLLPWMRQAGVTRVLSLDPLEHSELEPRAAVPLGPPGLTAHVYGVSRSGPLVYVACRVLLAGSREEALALPMSPGFDLERDVSLEQEAVAGCAEGSVSLEATEPAEHRYRVKADAPALLVERENFARGWRAEVDGRPVPVLRGNGKGRAVPFPAGAHEIVLRYRAPLLSAGALVSLCGLLVVSALLARGSAEAPRPGPRTSLALRCPACGREPLEQERTAPPPAPGLLPDATAASGPDWEVRSYRCTQCGASYPTREGIVDLTSGRGGLAGYDPHYFGTLPQVENTHFWFVSRREHILDALRRHVPDLSARSLVDVGCGTGGLLSWIERSGIAVAAGCDAHPLGLQLARARLAAPVLLVDPDRPPPLASGQTLISFFDVLEHLDDDASTLEWARSVLAPGGILVLTVPAHPFLFDEMDELAHHRRRYRRSELAARLRGAGFEIRHLEHFMAQLVPLLVIVRRLGRLLAHRVSDPARRRDAELGVVPGLNALLLLALRLEGLLGRLVPWPFGTSLIAVAARPREGEGLAGAMVAPGLVTGSGKAER